MHLFQSSDYRQIRSQIERQQRRRRQRSQTTIILFQLINQKHKTFELLQSNTTVYLFIIYNCMYILNTNGLKKEQRNNIYSMNNWIHLI